MNIFATSDDPYDCAVALDDVRVNKMIIESAQLLCTALRRTYGFDDPVLYRVAHVNHPCEIWTRNPNNFRWLLEHALELWYTKVKYSGGTHKTGDVLYHIARNYLLRIPAGNWFDHTPFRNCTPHKDMPDVHAAYRVTMREKWAADAAIGRHPTWRGRPAPDWR